MSGWFTTWTFWVGALWGASVTEVVLTRWLIRPMGKLLGWERGGVSPSGKEQP